jgi:hypothetical protein
MPKVLVGGAFPGSVPPIFKLDEVPRVKKKIILTDEQIVGERSEAHAALIGLKLKVVLSTQAKVGGEEILWIGIQGNAPK